MFLEQIPLKWYLFLYSHANHKPKSFLGYFVLPQPLCIIYIIRFSWISPELFDFFHYHHHYHQALSYPDRIFVSYLIHLHSLALIRETKGKLQIWLHLPFGLPATKISIHKTLSGFSSLLGLTALEWLLQLLNMVYSASALVRFRSLANSHTSSLLQAHWPFGPAFLPVSFCYRVFAQVAFLSLEIPSTGNSLFILQLPASTSSGRCSLISPIRLDLLLALRVPCTVLYITYHKFTLFVWLYDWKLREAWNCVCICSPSYAHCQS